VSETRNLIDHYWYWDTEAIKVDLDEKRHPFGILISNLGNDFNIGSVIRNSNAFLAKSVYYFGRRKWDKRGAVGTYNYISLQHIPEGSLDLIEGYNWVGIDNLPGAIPIDDFQWPENTLMCFGQEQAGLPDSILERCDSLVYIKQFGSVRSLNVGCASAIAMYDWCRKNEKNDSDH